MVSYRSRYHLFQDGQETFRKQTSPISCIIRSDTVWKWNIRRYYEITAFDTAGLQVFCR